MKANVDDKKVIQDKGANTPEPMPMPNNRPAVWDLVVADMIDRDFTGQVKYGTRLQPFNGRNSLVDAYQEVLDLAVYLRQTIFEFDELKAKNLELESELASREYLDGEAIIGAELVNQELKELRAENEQVRKDLAYEKEYVAVLEGEKNKLLVAHVGLEAEKERLCKVIDWLSRAYGVRYSCANCGAELLDGTSVEYGVDDAGLEIIFCEKCNEDMKGGEG